MANTIEELCVRLRAGERFHDAGVAVGIRDPSRWWQTSTTLSDADRRDINQAAREGRAKALGLGEEPA